MHVTRAAAIPVAVTVTPVAVTVVMAIVTALVAVAEVVAVVAVVLAAGPAGQAVSRALLERAPEQALERALGVVS